MASKLKNIIYVMKITHTRSKINTITKLDSKRRKGGRRQYKANSSPQKNYIHS